MIKQQVHIERRGSAYWLVFPKAIAKLLKIKIGDAVDLSTKNGAIILTRVKKTA